MMKKVVISLGGSILVKGEEDSDYIRRISDLLRDLSGNCRFIVVTGGGKTAREYIRIGRDLGSDEASLDWIGIYATRLNSYLLILTMYQLLITPLVGQKYHLRLSLSCLNVLLVYPYVF